MLGICLSIFIFALALFIIIFISLREIRSVKKQKFTCLNCGKTFFPKVSLSSLVNFGDKSKIVKCSYCGHKDRIHPIE